MFFIRFDFSENFGDLYKKIGMTPVIMMIMMVRPTPLITARKQLGAVVTSFGCTCTR